MQYEQNKNAMEIYNELSKRRMLAATLIYDDKTQCYTLTYEVDYLRSKSSIPLGPEFPVHQLQHTSKPGTMFPSFLDRISDKENPAYPDYCRSQGISSDETNLIVLLTTIGRRGPSTFVFEAVYKMVSSVSDELIAFRKAHDLARWDFAMAFDFKELTLLKVEQGRCNDSNILRLIDIYLHQPKLALQQLELTGKHVHADTRTKLYRYFKSQTSDPKG